MTWLPFDLHPEYPPEGIPRSELEARYGGRLHERVRHMFDAVQLLYNPPPDVVPNSRLALRLAELARDRGRHDEFHDRLMAAYWSEARNIGDPDVLRELARECGLEDDEVERVLAGDEYLERVRASTAQAQGIGISGIPAWLLDERLLVLGAQSHEAFEEAFARLASPPSGT